MTDTQVRISKPEDMPALDALYPTAFPDEDLLPVMHQLVRERSDTLSLVALCDGAVAGHIVFTSCALEDGNWRVALLGPLAVAPPYQRQGLGRALIEAGLAHLRAEKVPCVLVLGDPGYYGRLGFRAELAIAPPYDLPPEWGGAWQSYRLDGTLFPATRLAPPEVWCDPALWLP